MATVLLDKQHHNHDIAHAGPIVQAYTRHCYYTVHVLLRSICSFCKCFVSVDHLALPALQLLLQLV
jgi:hypothetical protein